MRCFPQACCWQSGFGHCGVLLCVKKSRHDFKREGNRAVIGFAIGLVCGAGELYLLTRLTLALQGGHSMRTLGIVMLKLLLYACALTPVALFFRSDLIWCGVGISSVLIVGALVYNVLSRRKGKGDR